jgi:flagellar protein FlgJ
MATPLDISPKSVLDTQALAQLRVQARQSPDQALKSAAQQFEAVFLDMVMKSMREATPQDGMFDSEQTRMFTGMLDQQLAQSMSSRGIGLAEIMVRQLSRSRADQALPASSATGSKVQQDFINRMLPHAIKAGESSGVPHTLMLGQAALESGWGQREIRTGDGSTSHNVFGIKAGSAWQGKTADVVTTEYEDGVPRQRVEKFRAYGSYAEAFQDYARLIANNPRYTDVLRHTGDHEAVAKSVQQAGYATDPHYAEKLAKVMGATAKILNDQA